MINIMFFNNKVVILTYLFFAFYSFNTSVAKAAEVSLPEKSISNTVSLQHTRTLAASCAACHGTNGNSLDVTPVLAGLDSYYFTVQMLAFKHGTRPATVMHHHAKGLTVDEINALSIYFSQQKRVTPPNLKSQTLGAQHD